MRRLVRALAASRGQALTPADVRLLGDEPLPGCLAGCLFAVVYPLKKIFRKVLYFLEWKRAADTASRTFYFGTLFDYALEQRLLAPAGPHDTARVRAAIDKVLGDVGTALVERAFRETFRRSAQTLRGAAGFLQASLRKVRGRPTDEQVDQALDALVPEQEVEAVAGAVEAAMQQIPEEHWARVKALLAAELKRGTP